MREMNQPHTNLTRRSFACGVIAAGATLAARTGVDAAKKKPPYKKAVKIGMVNVKGSLTEKFKVLKALGYDGVELNSPNGPSPDAVRRAKEATGLDVHGVVDSIHWRQTLSDPNAAVRRRGREGLKTALHYARHYGATSVLLVPAVKRKGVADYQQCWDRSLAEIKKVMPLAEDLGIHLLIENVWNNFLVDPKEYARYIDAMDSKMAGAYFDVGNAVRYSAPHTWVPILGKRIVKLDIKEFDLEKAKKEGMGKGFAVKLLEGTCQWPKVMAELRKIGYKGWGTAEIPGGGRKRLKEIAGRMDRIFAS